MSHKVVRDFHAIFNKHVTIKRPKISAYKCIKNIYNYIKFIKQKHAPKDYLNNPNNVIGKIYRINPKLKNNNEYKDYCRIQISLAYSYFKDLLLNIKNEEKVNYYSIKKYYDHIHDFLHDISGYIDYFEKNENEEKYFLNGGKAYAQKGWMRYHNAINKFWNKNNNEYLSNKNNFNDSVFNLRQSIEIKCRNIIGISIIYDRKLNPIKLRHEFFLEFLNQNKDIIETNYQNLTGIIKIFQWTNISIHTSIMPYVWEQWYALRYCQDFFNPSPIIEGKPWSRDNAIKIKNYPKLINKFYDSLKNQNIACIEFKDPEAEIIDNTIIIDSSFYKEYKEYKDNRNLIIKYFNKSIKDYCIGDIKSLLNSKINCAGPLLTATLNGIDNLGGILYSFNASVGERSKRVLVEKMNIDKDVASIIYNSIRCGIVHQFMPKMGITYFANYDMKFNEIYSKDTVGKNIIINVCAFANKFIEVIDSINKSEVLYMPEYNDNEKSKMIKQYNSAYKNIEETEMYTYNQYKKDEEMKYRNNLSISPYNGDMVNIMD